jgi:DNA replicative helicase MCM subunit Mcm2 (Cdc46/Mcm family)
LLKYIQFVIQINPQLTDKVKEHLKDAYIELRRTSKNLEISPRILNTMIRLTLASARSYQRKEDDEIDSDNTVSLMKNMQYVRQIL